MTKSMTTHEIKLWKKKAGYHIEIQQPPLLESSRTAVEIGLTNIGIYKVLLSAHCRCCSTQFGRLEKVMKSSTKLEFSEFLDHYFWISITIVS